MKNKSVTYQVRDFNLDHIFDCGQCFRWTRQEDGSWVGIAGGQVVRMHLSPCSEHFPAKSVQPELSRGSNIDGTAGFDGVLTIEGTDESHFEDFWFDYLDLGRDYGEIKKSLSENDSQMSAAIQAGSGIRILKQDFWETMVSFLISQNNNIPRIKGCIESLCRLYGEPVMDIYDGAAGGGAAAAGTDGNGWFSIPSPEVLSRLSEEDLKECRMGYRAKYMIEMAKQVLERGGADAVYEQILASDNPIEALTEFTGVGPKVASCIALFGVGRYDAFPIDVWMRRAMNTVYGIEENRMAQMQEYAREHFGKYGGFAQQYLFYYIRGLGQK